jgi:hypothetical protein
MTATQNQSSKNGERCLYLAFDLGWSEWKLAFCSEAGDPARLRTISARDLDLLRQELVKAKKDSVWRRTLRFTAVTKQVVMDFGWTGG